VPIAGQWRCVVQCYKVRGTAVWSLAAGPCHQPANGRPQALRFWTGADCRCVLQTGHQPPTPCACYHNIPCCRTLTAAPQRQQAASKPRPARPLKAHSQHPYTPVKPGGQQRQQQRRPPGRCRCSTASQRTRRSSPPSRRSARRRGASTTSPSSRLQRSSGCSSRRCAARSLRVWRMRFVVVVVFRGRDRGSVVGAKRLLAALEPKHADPTHTTPPRQRHSQAPPSTPPTHPKQDVIFTRHQPPGPGSCHSLFMVCDGHQGVGAARHVADYLPWILGRTLPRELPDWDNAAGALLFCKGGAFCGGAVPGVGLGGMGGRCAIGSVCGEGGCGDCFGWWGFGRLEACDGGVVRALLLLLHGIQPPHVTSQ